MKRKDLRNKKRVVVTVRKELSDWLHSLPHSHHDFAEDRIGRAVQMRPLNDGPALSPSPMHTKMLLSVWLSAPVHDFLSAWAEYLGTNRARLLRSILEEVWRKEESPRQRVRGGYE